jgi:hypothetical protein
MLGITTTRALSQTSLLGVLLFLLQLRVDELKVRGLGDLVEGTLLDNLTTLHHVDVVEVLEIT